MSERKEVIKHSAAIQISNVVNLLQRRAWNVLLANAFDELSKKDEFEIPIRQLCSSLKYDSRNDKHLKQLLRDLLDIKVEWNVLHKDDVEWGIAVLLAQAQIINGVLIYGYAPILRKRLHNPAMYAKISLSLQNKFDSKHSLALYELFIDYFNIKMEQGSTPVIPIDEFRKLLGLNNDEYKVFGDLNKWVIKKAVNEINDKSDLHITTEYRRENRKVIAVRFDIAKNNRNFITNEILDINDTVKQICLPLPGYDIDNQELLKTLTEEFGISYNKAIAYLKTMDEFYILDVLELVRDHIEKGHVNDISAFTVKALEDDYRRKKNQNEIKKDELNNIKIAEQKEKEYTLKIRNEFEEKWQNKIENVLDKMSEDKIKLLIERFEKEKVRNNIFLKQEYVEKGMNGLFIKAMYYDFVSNIYLEEEERDFDSYAEKKGYQIKKSNDGETIITGKNIKEENC